MAKTSSGGATTTKTKLALSAERGKAEAAASPPDKAGAKKIGLTKAAPPKMAAASRSAVAKKGPLPELASGKGTDPVPKKAVAKSTVSAKHARKSAAIKPAAKVVSVKKAAARRTANRPAVPTPAARRARAAAASRKSVTPPPHKTLAATPSEVVGGAPQTFTVSHLNQNDFKADGLRPYARYRDLGIAAATGGLCQAHVIRFVLPCTDTVRKRHVHAAELQLVYVLQGWMKNEFEGEGEQMMSAGSCWLQPSGIRHTVLDYSSDCEVLEIIIPANFKTEELV